MTKFTKGPWIIDERTELLAIRTKQGYWIANANPYQVDGPSKKRKADARLIAAAPDMFAALTELLDAWDGYELTAALDHHIREKAVAALELAGGSDETK